MIPIVSVKTVVINDFRTDIVFTYADGSEVVKTAYNDERILDYNNVAKKWAYCCHIESNQFYGFTGLLDYKAMNYEYVQEDNQLDNLYKSAYIEMNYDFKGIPNIRTTFAEEDVTADLFIPIPIYNSIIGMYGKYAYCKGYDTSIDCITIRRFDMVARAIDPNYAVNINGIYFHTHRYFNKHGEIANTVASGEPVLTFRYGHLQFTYMTCAVSTLYLESISGLNKLNRSSDYSVEIAVRLDPEISYGFIDFVDISAIAPDIRFYNSPIAPHLILVPSILGAYSLRAVSGHSYHKHKLINILNIMKVSSYLSDDDFESYAIDYSDIYFHKPIVSTGGIHTDALDVDVWVHLPIKDYREYIEFKINPNEKDKLGHTQKFSDCKFVTSDGLNIINTKTKRHELLSKYIVPALQASLTNNFYKYGKLLPYPDSNGDAYYLVNIDKKNEVIRVNYRDFNSCRPKCSVWDNKQPMDYYDDLIVDDDEKYLRLTTTTYTTINDDMIPLEGLEFFGYGELPKINKTIPLGIDIFNNSRFIPSMMNNTLFLYYGEEEPITININRLFIERNHLHMDSYHTAIRGSVKFSLGSIQVVFPELGIMSSQYNCRFVLMDITRDRISHTGNYTVGSTVNLTDYIVEYASSDEFTNRHIYDIELEVYNRNHYSVYSESIFKRTIHCYLSKEKAITIGIKVEMPNFTYNTDYRVMDMNGEVIPNYDPSIGTDVSFIMEKKNTSNKNTIMRVYKDGVLIGDSGTSVVIDNGSNFIISSNPIVLFKSEVNSMVQTLVLNEDGLTYSFRLESFVLSITGGTTTRNKFILRDGDGEDITIPSTYLSTEDDGNTMVVNNLPKQWIEDNVLLGSSYYMFVVSREVIIGGKDSLYEGEYVYKVYP